MTSLQEQYQAERRQVSASGIYTPPRPAAPRPSNYIENSYQGLGDYAQSSPASKFSQRQGESDQAYVNRLRPLTAHLAESLPQEELATVTEQYNSAVERLNGTQTHVELRQHLAGRQGVGTGIMGNSTPQQRAAALGSRFGGAVGRGQGDLANRALQAPGQPVITSASQINQIMAQREAERTGPPVQRADVRQLRSTGTGWMAR